MNGEDLFQKFGISPEDVPNWSAKLYGGLQLERLLAEFKMLTDRILLEGTSEDEIINASGLSGRSNFRRRNE